uniref:Uncharacterized protein n=1 Tax=Arundo donax TaxID=35708 RepID=A0A0A9QJN6_ARUDO
MYQTFSASFNSLFRLTGNYSAQRQFIELIGIEICEDRFAPSLQQFYFRAYDGLMAGWDQL